MGFWHFSKSVAKAFLKEVTEKPPFSDEEYAKIWQPEPNEQMGWKNLTAGNWKVRADGFERSGRYDEALACLDVAVKLEPQNAWMWNAKGEFLSRLGRYDEAIQCYDTSLEINPYQAWLERERESALNELNKR